MPIPTVNSLAVFRLAYLLGIELMPPDATCRNRSRIELPAIDVTGASMSRQRTTERPADIMFGGANWALCEQNGFAMAGFPDRQPSIAI